MCKKIVIAGVSGTLGKKVAERLVEKGAGGDVRFGSRNAEALAPLADQGFETARIDYADRAGMEKAFAGADTFFMISANGPDDLRIVQHRAAIDAAKNAGVRRIVYTSFTNPTYESLFTAARVHAETESYLAQSGLAVTLLRNNQYIGNIAGTVAQAKATGVLSSPDIGGKVAYFTHDDLADAVDSVLTGAGHEGKNYEITGPEAVSLIDLADDLSKAWGTEVKAVPGDPAMFEKIFADMGFPPFVIALLMSIYRASAAGEMAHVSGDLERLIGRRPVSARQAVVDLA